MENPRNEKLWHIAKQRARFKRHVMTYLAVNAFFWAIWLFTRDSQKSDPFPWPAWASLGWGFGLIMNYLQVYHFYSESQAEKEYKKLLDEK